MKRDNICDEGIHFHYVNLIVSGKQLKIDIITSLRECKVISRETKYVKKVEVTLDLHESIYSHPSKNNFRHFIICLRYEIASYSLY
jgi:hypothetical protein